MILSELRKGEKMEKKYVFRNIEDAPAYDVSNCEGGLGTIKTLHFLVMKLKCP